MRVINILILLSISAFLLNCSENNTGLSPTGLSPNIINCKIYEGNCRYPVWSASGDYIVFEGNGEGTPGLYIIDTEGNKLRLLLKDEGFGELKPLDFSNDDYLIFNSWVDDFTRIYYLQPNGKNPVFIANGNGTAIYGNINDYYNIVYLPWIDLYVHYIGIYVTDTHHSKPKLLNETIVPYPDISPDGKRLAYFRGEENSVNIYVYDIETKEEKFICEVSNFGCTCLRWSPDGKWLAFNGGYTLDRKNFSKRVVWIVSSEGGEPTPLFDDPNYPYWCSPGVLSFSWSPDGKWIVYDMGTEGELWKVRVFE